MAISSPRPATVKRSATKKTRTTTTATSHSGSYWPLSTEVNDPANQMPRLCSMFVDSAM